MTTCSCSTGGGEGCHGVCIRVIDASFTALSRTSLGDILPGEHCCNPSLSLTQQSSHSTQNRYLPMLYTVWIVACMCCGRRFKIYSLSNFIIANLSWAFTNKVSVSPVFHFTAGEKVSDKSLSPTNRCASEFLDQVIVKRRSFFIAPWRP